MRRTSRWSVRIARIAGVDIRVHVSFLFLVALFAVPYSTGPSVAANLAFLAVIAVCIVAHELAHSIVARRRGATVREILLLPIGGVSKLEHLPESPADEFAIAIVGPATSVAIAGATALVAFTARVPLLPVTLATGSLLQRTVWFNLIVGMFNLLPAFPLDGGRVFRSLLERHLDLETATRRAARLGRVLAVALVIVGVFVNFWFVLIGGFVYLGASAEEAATVIHLRIKGRRIGDAMLLDPLTLDVANTVEDVNAILRHTTQRWFPSTDSGRCVGILDVESLGHLAAGDPIRSRVVACAPLDAIAALEEGFERLQTDRLGALPVVSSGKIVGLLRVEDVAHMAQRAAPSATAPST